MSTTVAPERTSLLTAEFITPVITATKSVFEMMLDCTPTRTSLRLRTLDDPRYEVSAVIGISGKAAGTVVMNLSHTSACEVLRRMVGIETNQITREVCDAVGELTNMIAGSAKAQLAKYELSLSLPNVVSGDDHMLHFPSDVTPMVISFSSDIGPLTIEVGFTGM